MLSSGPNPATKGEKPLPQSGEKDKGRAKLCSFFAAGTCRKGAECTFVHNAQAEQTAKKPVPQTKKVEVQLDVKLDDAVFTRVSSAFASLTINNGVGKEEHPHAESRAVRTCVEGLVKKLIGKDSFVLELQGKHRGPELPKHEFCRRSYYAEDLEPNTGLCDAGIVDGVCKHERGLLDGRYDTILMLDVPIGAVDVGRLLEAYPRVSRIVLALHVHSVLSGVAGDQTFTWMNEPGPIGSIGHFSSICDGRVIKEPDHYWLTAELPMCGVKPSLWSRVKAYDYSVYEFTRNVVITPDVQLLNADTWLKLRTAFHPAEVCGMPCWRFSSSMGVFKFENLFLGVNPLEVEDELRHVAGVATTDAVRGRMAARVRRVKGVTAFEALQSVVCEIKRVQETPHLEAEYSPSRTRRFFNWCGKSRRERDSINASMREGTWVQGWTAGIVKLVAALVSIVVGVLPWIWPAFVEVAAYHTFPWVVSVSTAAWGPIAAGWLPTGLQLPWYPKLSLSWDWGYTTWSVPFRVVLFGIAFSLLVGSAQAVSTQGLYSQYVQDPFQPIHFVGPLEANDGWLFGLPGLVSDRPLRPIADGCEMRVKAFVPDLKPEANKMFALGVVFSNAVPIVYKSCQENMILAVRNRQIADMGEYNLSSFREVATAWFRDVFSKHEFAEHTTKNFEEWNADFPGNRRVEHQKAYDDVKRGTAPPAAVICQRKSFNKVEKLNAREHKDPRCITGGTSWWNVLFGPWMSGMASVFKERFNCESQIFYATSTNFVDLGSWFDRADDHYAVCGDDQIIVLFDQEFGWVYLIGDGGRHDAHMHEGFWELKWRCYEHVASPLPNRIDTLVKASQEHTFSKANFEIEYSHPYRVRSGDPDTSMGNSVCTDFIASTTVLWFREHRARGTGLQATSDLIVQRWATLGYDLELEITLDSWRAEFLSGCFMPVGGVTYWIPKVGRLLSRIGWFLTRAGKVGRWRYLAGTINSFKQYRFVPFLRVYLERIMQLIPEQYRHTPPRYETWGVGAAVGPMEPEADSWEFFLCRYGLTERDEKSFQVGLNLVDTLPFALTDESVGVMVGVDC